MISGTVKLWNAEKAFGFVLTPDGAELFAHQNQIVDGKTPQKGDMVNFDFEESKIKPGLFQACNISGGTGGDTAPKPAPQQLLQREPSAPQPRGIPNPNHVATGQFSGQVKSYVCNKGYGFIIGPDGSSIFAHVNAIADERELVQGDIVTFDIEPSKAKEGQMAAKNIAGGTGGMAPPPRVAKPQQFVQQSLQPPCEKNLNHTATGTFTGTVKSYVIDKAYGFIIGPDGSSMFAHANGIADERHLRQGDVVTFDIEASKVKEGQFAALNIAGGTGGEMAHKPTPKGNTSHVATGVFTGKVKSYVWNKGFGFITGPDNSDVFVHMQDIVDGHNLKVNDMVTFDIEYKAETSKTVAVNVAGGTGWPLAQNGMIQAGKGGSGDGWGDGWGDAWGCDSSGFGAAKGEGKGKDGPYGWGDGWSSASKGGGKGGSSGQGIVVKPPAQVQPMTMGDGAGEAFWNQP